MPLRATADHTRDSELFVLLDRWREAQAAWVLINEGAFAGVQAAREATRPPRPEALFWRHRDTLHDVGSARGHEGTTDTARRTFYDVRDIERLRRAPPLTTWYSPDSETMPVPARVSDSAGEARRHEIVGAHDRWAAECRAAEDACGFTRARAIEEATAAALNDAEEAVKLCQPRFLAGLARKAAWVADLLARDAGDDDLGEVFARQVAVFMPSIELGRIEERLSEAPARGERLLPNASSATTAATKAARRPPP